MKLKKKGINAPFGLDDPVGFEGLESITFLDMFGAEDKSILSVENKDMVDYCMSKLNPLERKAIRLHSMGATTRRIAELTGYSQPHISRTLLKAQEKIRAIRAR